MKIIKIRVEIKLRLVKKNKTETSIKPRLGSLESSTKINKSLAGLTKKEKRHK